MAGLKKKKEGDGRKMTTKSLSEQIFEACRVDTNKYAYPDFETNNDNFVKLFELNFNDSDYSTIGEYITHTIGSIDTKETFLLELFETLDFNEYFTERTEKIKQAIREADWEY